MRARFVAKEGLTPLLGEVLADREVYATHTADDRIRLGRLAPCDIEVAPCRALDPLKSLFFRPRQDLGDYFGPAQTPSPAQRAVVGATACDLASLRILDYVFLEGEFVDPYYEALRRNTLIVSVDCTAPRDVCFCTFLEGKPYPETGFDLNLSPLEGGYVIEAGTQLGTDLLEQHGADSHEATQQQLKARQENRSAVAAQVDRQAKEAGLEVSTSLQDSVRRSRNAPLWEQLAEKCVECAACNFICPTCHCFLLTDLEDSQGFRRFKKWDACLYPAFAREASGANPRARRAERLHGRLEKKFDFIVANAGAWGCVGCGRCIEVCPGKIDMRETLKELANA